MRTRWDGHLAFATSERPAKRRAVYKPKSVEQSGSQNRVALLACLLGLGFSLDLALGRRCGFPRSNSCFAKRDAMGSPGFSRASRLLLLVGALVWLAPAAAAAAAAHYEADEGEELMRAFAFEEENLAEFARHRSSPAPFYRSNKVRRQERRKGGGERKEE